ncbi:MAG: sugar phosphate isomerase/epimerase family protein [Terriglobia bacterium]|jgi:sugar phosphate isomerase/epimerase
MVFISRRDAGKLLLAGCAGALVPAGRLRGATMINSVIRGVQIGAQSYSFPDLQTPEAILKAFQTVGLGECELSSGAEPANLRGPERAKWDREAPLDYFKELRKKYDDAGVLIYAYTYGFRKDFTDEQIEQGFRIAQALGVKYITSSANVSVAPRVDKVAQKYKIMVGFHGHDSTKPDEFSTPETFARAMKGASPYIGVNLDIGHFVAAGGDPVAYITEHHTRIVTLHIKDRKKDHGANLPFGQGDTPIVAVLQLLRDKGWKIPANIEYEYGKPGMDTIAEMKKCFEYCKKALES